MAIAPVVIEFLAKGMPQVQQAFQSIAASAEKASKAQQASAQRAVQTAEKAAEREARAKIAAMKKADTWQRQAQDAGYKYTDNLRKQDLAKEKAAQKVGHQLVAQGIAAKKNALAELDRWQSQARKKQLAEEKAAAKERERIHAQEHRQHRYNISRTAQANKDLDKWQKGQQAAAPPKLVKPHGPNESARGRFAEAVVGAGTRAVIRGVERTAQMGMGLATTAAQLGGGFSIADVVMSEQNLRKKAATLSAGTLLAGSHSRDISTDEILAKAKAVGVTNNMDPEQVLESFEKIKKLTGNLDQAMSISGYVAKLARASGSDVEQVSGLAANILAGSPKIADEDLFSQLRLFTRQGVVGGVELEDFARYGARITAGATYFGGNRQTNEGVLGAMAQMARQKGGASSPAEAALGAQRFGSDLANHSDKLKESFDIDVRDGQGNIRDAEGLILDILEKTGGDVTKLGAKITGLGERGVKPLLGAAATYKEAGGGARGLQAVRDEFRKYTEGTRPEEVDAASARAMSEQGFEQQFLALKIVAGQELLPLFKDMLPAVRDILSAFVGVAKVGIPAFTELMKQVAGFAQKYDWLIKDIAANPIGSLIAAEMIKSFAAAQLPALLRALYSGAFAGGIPGVGGAPGTPGAGGVPGAPGAPSAPGGGSSVLAGTLLTTGVMAAILMQADNYARIRTAESAGAKRAEEVSKMDPARYAEEVEKAKGNSSWLSGYGTKYAQSALDVLSGGTTYGVRKATDWASNAMGLKSGTDVAELNITNRSMLEELRKITANTAQGGSPTGGGNSGSGGAGRKRSLLDRN